MNKSPLSSSALLARKKWLLSIFCLLAMVLLGAVFYYLWDNYRTTQTTKASRSLFDDGDSEAALKVASEAYSRSPDNPKTIRLLAEILSSYPQEARKAIYFYKRLQNEGHSNAEDLISLSKIYQKNGQNQQALNTLEQLELKHPEQQQLHQLKELRESLLGHHSENISKALSSTNSAPKKTLNSPSTARERLEMIRLQLQGNKALSPYQLSNIKKTLWEMAENKKGRESSSLQALEILSSATQLTSHYSNNKETAKLIELLKSHPKRTEQHELIALSITLNDEPAQREQLIANEIEKRLGKPINELISFLTWLQREGEDGWLLQILSLENSKNNSTAASIYLQALLNEEQWENLQKAVNSKDLPISEGRKSYLRVKTNQGLEQGDTLLRKHLSICIDRLTILSTYEQWKSYTQKQYYQIAQENKETRKLLQLCQEILDDEPENEAFTSTSNYLALLLGENVEAAAASATLLHSSASSSTRDASKNLVHALALYRMGDRYAASREANSIDPLELPAGQRAVQAFLLQGQGDARKIYKIAETISTDLCLQEEQQFLKRALR